jgi:hypothetical protein
MLHRLKGALACTVAVGLFASCSDDTQPLVIETTLVTDTNDVVGPYEVLSIIRDDQEVSEAWVFFSTDGKRNFDSTPMARLGSGEVYIGDIRGFPLGTRVDYYVLARDAATNIGTDPAPVPDNTHCFMVGTLPAHPQVLLVTPTRGPTTGGTAITLIGQDFRPGARVFLGAAEAEQVVVADSSLITAVTPAGDPGYVDVTVQDPSASDLGPAACPGESNQPGRGTLPNGFLYVLPPKPTSVTPDHGPTSGGTSVTVSGTGFQPGAMVTFDGNPADCTVVDASTITCITPPGDPGPADVQVTNPDGFTGLLPAGYVYVPPPELLSVDPPRGPDTGGTAVTLHGRAFQNGAIPFFDNLQLLDVTFVDEGTITAVTPPHAVGYVDVRLRNPDGQEARLPRGFFYFGPPMIEAIIPPQGPTSGGQTVRIDGSSFVPGLTVTFDGLPAMVVSVTDNEIIVITPPHAEGAVTVTVTNPDGRSGDGTYTYVPSPEIASLMPTCGPTAGGTAVNIQGFNFQAGAVVLFGDVQAPQTTVSSPSVLDTVTPPHDAGDVEVRVRNPDLGETTMPGTFTFVPAPRVDAVSPPSMLLCGGVTIAITGADFLPGATVMIGDTPCADLQIVSPSEIHCTAPSGPPGPRRIAVTNHVCLDQTSTGAVDLSYEPLALHPSGGLVSGYTNVRISHSLPVGRPVTAVSFGGTNALEIQNAADLSTALAQSPPHAIGEFDVQVTLQGCPPETAAPRFQFRVLADRTAQRLPHPPCNGTPRQCHAASIKFGDLNGDGLNDFAQANGGIQVTARQSNRVYMNQPNQPGFFTSIDLPDEPRGPQNSARVDVGDIDGDGRPELLFATSTGGGLLYMNDGQGNFRLAPFSRTLEALGGSFDAQFADVNNDGRPDIVYLEIGISQDIGTPRNGPDHVFLNMGGGNFSEVANAFPSTIFSVHDHKMAINRFNSDNNLDMAVVVDTHFVPQPSNRYLVGDGSGRFQLFAQPAFDNLQADMFGIETGDFNGDGHPDLFIAAEGAAFSGGECGGITIRGHTNILLLNDGTGVFVDRSDLLPPFNEPTIGSAAFDIDGDGDLDLVAVNFGVPTRIYLNDGRGNFHDASDAFLDPPVCSLSAAGAPIDPSGVPALVMGGQYDTRIWIQTTTP